MLGTKGKVINIKPLFGPTTSRHRDLEDDSKSIAFPCYYHCSYKMDLGSNFSVKLEPFLLMAKSLKGAAAAKLIQDATSAPGVFVFSELLELSNIQEVSLALSLFFTSEQYCSLRKANNTKSRLRCYNFSHIRPMRTTFVCWDRP